MLFDHPQSRSYLHWWLGEAPVEVDDFLEEEFKETQRGLGMLLCFGALFFLLRGLLEIYATQSPTWEVDSALRLVGSAFFFGLWGAYQNTKHPGKRAGIFALYLFVYLSFTVWWAGRYDMHIGYLAAPLVLCLLLGVILWPVLHKLYWPMAAVIAPTLVYLTLTHASLRDWVTYLLCFMVTGLFSITIRRTRLRTSYALFACRVALQAQADLDALTGLHNLSGWRRMTEKLCRHGKGKGDPLSLVFFDVDHFKQVNDAHGHAAGDAVLIHMARVMERVLRAGDILARVGGEEFVLALPNTKAEQAEALAKRVQQDLLDNPGVVPITISAGVAEVACGDDLSVGMGMADEQLLEAKRLGRNRVCVVYSPL